MRSIIVLMTMGGSGLVSIGLIGWLIASGSTASSWGTVALVGLVAMLTGFFVGILDSK